MIPSRKPPPRSFAPWLALALAAALALSVVGAASADTYIVQPGDTLTRIAARHNTTVAALVTANQSRFPCLAVNPACLQIGWSLMLPGGAQSPAATSARTYTVKSGDSLSRIAQKLGVSVNALVGANKGARPCLANPTPCPLQIGWVLTVPGNAPGGQAAVLNTPQSVFEEYVAALNARDAARLIATIHPAVPHYGELDVHIAELFLFADAYALSYKLAGVQVLSQSADTAQVMYLIDGASASIPYFTTDTEYEVTLKRYQGRWLIFSEEAGLIEFTR